MIGVIMNSLTYILIIITMCIQLGVMYYFGYKAGVKNTWANIVLKLDGKEVTIKDLEDFDV